MVSFEVASENFTNWLKDENVYISKSIALRDLRDHNQGRGLVAIEDIKADESLFIIPRSLCLSVDNCTLVKDRPDLKAKLLKSNHWDSLIVVLLYELKVVGDKSPWKHYFNILPIIDDRNYVFNQLMFWNEDELNLLNPSVITERIGKNLAEEMYNKLYPKTILDDYGLHGLKNFTLKEYHQLASLIMAYSFDVEKPESFGKPKKDDDNESDDYDEEHDNDDNEDYESGSDADNNGHAKTVDKSFTNVDEATHDDVNDIKFDDDEDENNILHDDFFKTMVPLADTLNADTTKHNSSLMYTKQDLVMKSIKSIKKGDQIYNTYSDHPNSEILRRYGYVESTGSKFDFGEIPISLIKQVFLDSKAISANFLEEVLSIINEIIAGDPDDLPVEIVLDSYDCFKTGEVILELIFIIQILTIISTINLLKSMEHLRYESKYTLINRIFKKTYQLIESKKLTKLFLTNYKKIINLRISQYPDITNKSDDLSSILTREMMAQVVLKSEVQSFNNCLDVDKVFNNEENKYRFIDDDKLIKNIVKKKFFTESPSTDEDLQLSEELSVKKQKTE